MSEKKNRRKPEGKQQEQQQQQWEQESEPLVLCYSCYIPIPPIHDMYRASWKTAGLRRKLRTPGTTLSLKRAEAILVFV